MSATRDFRRHEIGRDALAQIARLADVDHAVESIAHEVNARLVRHLVHFLVEIGLFFRQQFFFL